MGAKELARWGYAIIVAIIDAIEVTQQEPNGALGEGRSLQHEEEKGKHD